MRATTYLSGLWRDRPGSLKLDVNLSSVILSGLHERDFQMSTDDNDALRERAERAERDRDEAIATLEAVLKKLKSEVDDKPINLNRGKRHKNVAAESSPLMSALTTEFQTVKELWRSAQAQGYTGVENLLRYHMPKLIEAHPGKIIKQDKPLAWRLADEGA